MKKLFFLFAFAVMSVLVNAQRPLITKWNATDGIIKLRTIGASSYTYQKTTDATVTGSGTMASGLNTITLPSAGVYNLSITPTNSFRFVFNNAGLTPTDIAKFVELSQWGDIKWNPDLSAMFSGCTNLIITATDIPDLSNVENLSSLFSGCNSINTIPNINRWNISNIHFINSMFSGMKNFNADLSNWDVSNVTNMAYLFSGSVGFNGNISSWNTQNVTDMSGMFSNAISFNSDITQWNTSKVQYMTSMFSGATNFNQNISNWDVKQGWSFVSMFSGANNFNQNLEKWQYRNGYIYFDGIFNNSGLNCENYSHFLKGLARNNIRYNLSLSVPNMLYGPAGKVYRDILVYDQGWKITGDYFDPDCNVQLATGEVKLSNKSLQVYPNPTNGLFKIKTNTAEVATLYDYNGRLLKTQKLSAGENTMDISNLQNGVYLIKVGNDTSKIIKK